MRPDLRHGVVALGALLVANVPLGPAQAAPANAEQRAALLPLQFEGDVNEAWRSKLQDDLGRGLTQAGMEVIEPQAVMEASGGVGDCNNAKCFEFLSSSVEARFLVRAKIVVQDRNYDVGIDIIDGRDGSLAASSSEACQLCGLAEVGELVTKQAAVLRQKVDVLALEPAVVAITSEPSGAVIWIDGERIGATPLEHQLGPGKHRAEARKDGYVEQVRTLKVVQGVRERVSFELLPAAAPLEDEPAARPKDWKAPTGWALLGVGVGGLAAGVTFLAIDENPYRSRCAGPDVDAMGNCRQRYNTLAHGIALSVTGGALLVTGAALLIVDRARRGRRDKTTARRLQLGPGTIGGRF